jgi:hypothetical protein
LSRFVFLFVLNATGGVSPLRRVSFHLSATGREEDAKGLGVQGTPAFFFLFLSTIIFSCFQQHAPHPPASSRHPTRKTRPNGHVLRAWCCLQRRTWSARPPPPQTRKTWPNRPCLTCLVLLPSPNSRSTPFGVCFWGSARSFYIQTRKICPFWHILRV